MCSPSRSTSTVSVTCPGCRHEGPAYVYLLGELCRCKMCGHDFLMPRYFRMVRESFDRLMNCERLVDGLIGQLKTTQQEKERDRAAFERTLERLHDQLTTAKGHFESAHVSSDPSTEREASSRADSGPIITGSASAVESSI
jgi:hypothetical protein